MTSSFGRSGTHKNSEICEKCTKHAKLKKFHNFDNLQKFKTCQILKGTNFVCPLPVQVYFNFNQTVLNELHQKANYSVLPSSECILARLNIAPCLASLVLVEKVSYTERRGGTRWVVSWIPRERHRAKPLQIASDHRQLL